LLYPENNDDTMENVDREPQPGGFTGESALEAPPHGAHPVSAILEQNGIHVINSNLFTPDSETEAELNKDFRKLVDSVMTP
jgi:hypothetical protein